MSMADAASVATPELDKQHKAIEEGASEEIGEFLEWLGQQGYQIAYLPKNLYYCGNPECRGMAWLPCKEHARWEPFCLKCSENQSKGRLRPGSCGSASCNGEEYEHELEPVGHPIEWWLASYFNIDLQKVAEERTAILKAIRR